MRWVVPVIFAVFVTAFGVAAKDEPSEVRTEDVRKAKIIAIGEDPSEAALARKKRSHEVLEREGVPINRKLPTRIDASEAKARDHESVVRRTLAILCTAVKGEGLDQQTVELLIEDFGVADDLSPEEAAFIDLLNPSTVERVQFAWRYEAAWTMLWALSVVDELEPPREIIDVHRIGKIVRGENAKTLMEKTKLRPIEEILDQADLIYRYRWALVNARIKDREPPARLDPGVALERHRALNWLIGYLGQEWDDVTPDT